jgi:hypothetical protein
LGRSVDGREARDGFTEVVFSQVDEGDLFDPVGNETLGYCEPDSGASS